MKCRLPYFSTGVLILAASLLIVQSFTAVRAQDNESVSASWSHDTLHVTIPYARSHAGRGILTVEILNPEDKVIAHASQTVRADAGKGTWSQDLRIGADIALDDLVWHRVRYRFADEIRQDTALAGTESISQILRMPSIHVIGQQSYLAGGAAAVRVIVTDSMNEVVNGPGSVRIEMLGSKGEPALLLFAGALNQHGTSDAHFRFPAGKVGQHTLRYLAETAAGSTEFTQPVRLEDKVSILLTTEKPIYQPGQTIHVRALALDRADHAAAAARSLTFEVEDSRGNKVFKKATKTDEFGIASAEFALADEVNLGTYHLRALPAAGSSYHAEVAVNVERYVLPKFKVAVGLAEAGKQMAHGYRPGDHVTGTVRANYFFGKAVDGEVAIKASALDVGVFEAASAQGKTDADGAWHFDLKLPEYFAGRPLSQGAARVLIEATVKDSAGHAETRGQPIMVSQSPLILTAVPEGGMIAPNLDNRVFVLASYPDGKPAVADIRVRAAGNPYQITTTDAGGVAVVHVRAGGTAPELQIQANDHDGNQAGATLNLKVRSGEDQILLRAERAVYRAGDRMSLKIFATKQTGTAYLDVIRQGQTVVTRDVDLVNGQAELSLDVTPEMAGTLDLNAYLIGRNAQAVADHRLVFVQPADELKIDVSKDAPVYKPGDEARVQFRVVNGRGEGVQAALGVQVVDEAVFALAEKQPGFAKVFFYLEQEALKPRYEIHSISMSDVAEPAARSQAEQRDRAAQALFAATEMAAGNGFDQRTTPAIPRTKWYSEYRARYQERFLAQVRQFGDALLKEGSAAVPDAWGNPLKAVPVGDPSGTYYMVLSGGPDKRYHTGDDLHAYMGARTRGTLEVTIEHDRGALNDLAGIAGSVRDVTGASILATVTARELTNGKTRTAKCDGSGYFDLAGLPPGRYQVQVSAPGFQTASREVTLVARDRAVFKAALGIGSVSETVVVSSPMIGGGFGTGKGGAFGPGEGGGVGGGVFRPTAGLTLMEQMGMASKTDRFANTDGTHLGGIADKDETAAPRVRSYFPEALYINPEIITDGHGNATISIPLADSITTWRMAMMASTARGALGSGTSDIKVFRDFFADLDLPVTLTQGDRVSIPAAVYNYAGARGDVHLELQPQDWYAMVNDSRAKSLAVESGHVGSAQFTLEARRIGKFKLTLAARMTGRTERADIVVREIEVVPEGRERNVVFNGRLENTIQHELQFPPSTIPEASKIFVRLYPGPLSQVIEGMDAILRMPGGCFEQTSSSTYPNVLALDYMKRSKKLTPEVHAKAEGFIANGYQRLLTFEVPGGGFSWFGQAPANKILTAYGLMEFADMAKVYDVDRRLIQRTQQWLAGQQQPDGSWKPDTSFINEGATNRYNSDMLRITAYIAWSLGNTGYRGAVLDKARQFVQSKLDAKADPYTLAVLANFATAYRNDTEFTNRVMQLLLDARSEQADQVSWTAEETGVYGSGASAAVETTGLAAQALLKWTRWAPVGDKAVRYLASKKDAAGTWGSTQATIMALRAVLLSAEGSGDLRGTVELSLDGKAVETLALDEQNNDQFHQFVLKGIDARAPHRVELRLAGKGGLAYQVVGQYFVPWEDKSAEEPLAIGITYDRTHLAQDDIATATATVKNNLGKAANMVMVDLGIPPGFELLTEDLQAYQEKTAGQKGGRLEKFQLTAKQALLYFDSIPAGATVALKFRLRAKFPIRARTFSSRVYEYYDPDVSSVARPVQLEVRKR